MVVQLQESQRQMKDALSVFKSAVAANDPMQVADYQLNLEPDFRKAKQTLEVKEVWLTLLNFLGSVNVFYLLLE